MKKYFDINDMDLFGVYLSFNPEYLNLIKKAAHYHDHVELLTPHRCVDGCFSYLNAVTHPNNFPVFQINHHSHSAPIIYDWPFISRMSVLKNPAILSIIAN